MEINLDDEDNGAPDVLDPYDILYANVPSETHKLEAVENCEHCNAKKFEYETPGFLLSQWEDTFYPHPIHRLNL